MVQEFYVLKCHSCELFQVHIVKKAKKWSCKVCGQKQSVVKIFGQGSAKDCRIHVQKLNEQQSQNSKNLNEKYNQIDDCYEPEAEVNADEYSVNENVKINNSSEIPGPTPSKWQKYLESDETDEVSDNTNLRKRSSSCSSNSSQPNEADELDEPASKKLCFSRNDTSEHQADEVSADGGWNVSGASHVSNSEDTPNSYMSNVKDVLDLFDMLDDLDMLNRLDAF